MTVYKRTFNCTVCGKAVYYYSEAGTIECSCGIVDVKDYYFDFNPLLWTAMSHESLLKSRESKLRMEKETLERKSGGFDL